MKRQVSQAQHTSNAPPDGDFMANRSGYWGYGVSAAVAIGLVLWFGLPGVFARYPGRAVLGDDLYAQFPMTRGTCMLIALVSALAGTGLLMLGRSIHRKYREEWDAYLRDIAMQEEQQRLRFPDTKYVYELSFRRPLRVGTGVGADVLAFEELCRNILNNVRSSAAKAAKSGYCELVPLQLANNCDGPLDWWIGFNYYNEKWKSIRFDIVGRSFGGEVVVEVMGSVAMKFPGDPAPYAKQVTPVPTTETAREVLQKSVTHQRSQTNSPHGNSSTSGTSETFTPHYVEDVHGDYDKDFAIWGNAHKDAKGLFDHIKQTIIKTIETQIQAVEAQPLQDSNERRTHRGGI